MSTDTEKLNKLKIRLQSEIIDSYGRIIEAFSSHAKSIFDKLQYSRQESVGDEIVKIEMKLKGEYDYLLGLLSEIQNKMPKDDWLKGQHKLIERNIELLKEL